MTSKRIIPCLDVKDGRVVKGVNFVDLVDAGDAVENAVQYEREGADEITFLDITATYRGHKTVADMVARVAERLFIPFTVGGGIRSVDDMRDILRAGADKVGVKQRRRAPSRAVDRGRRRRSAASAWCSPSTRAARTATGWSTRRAAAGTRA